MIRYVCTLWLIYVCDAIEVARGKQRVFVDYDRSMHMPLPQLQRIASALDLSQTPEVAAAMKDSAREFLCEDLRHSCHSVGDLGADPCATEPVGLAAKLLDALADADGKEIDEARRVEVRGMFPKFAPLLGPASAALEKARAQAQAQSESLQRKTADLRYALSSRDWRINGLNATLAERDERIGTYSRGWPPSSSRYRRCNRRWPSRIDVLLRCSPAPHGS